MTFTVDVDELVAEAESRGVRTLLARHESWERVRLDRVADVQNGATFSSRFFNKTGDGLPLIRIRDVGRNRPETYYSGVFEERYIVESGDLLVGMDGDFRVAPWLGPRGLLNQRVCKIVARSPRTYDPCFLMHVLQGYLDAVNERTSSVTVKHLSSRTVECIPLPLPPYNEQRRVVAALEDYLSRIDRGVEGLTSVQQKSWLLDRRAKELTVRGGRRALPAMAAPSRTTEVPNAADRKGMSPIEPARIPDLDLPDDWSLASLGSLSYDWGYGTSTKCAYDASGVPVLRIPNVQNGEIDFSDTKNAVDGSLSLSGYFIEPGDLLFVRTNGSRQLIGRVAVVRGAMPVAFASYLIRFRLKPGLVEPDWVALVVSSPTWRRYLEEAAASSAGQYNLNSKLLARLPIPLPTLEEQRALLAEFAASGMVVDRVARELSAAKRRAAALRASLFAEAFAGRLVPQELSDEPASDLLVRILAERESTLPKQKKRTGRTRKELPAPPTRVTGDHYQQEALPL